MYRARSASWNWWEVQGPSVPLTVGSRDDYWSHWAEGHISKRNLPVQVSAKRAKICHFNVKICQIEDICVLKSDQRNMIIQTGCIGRPYTEIIAREARKIWHLMLPKYCNLGSKTDQKEDANRTFYPNISVDWTGNFRPCPTSILHWSGPYRTNI